MIREEKKNIQEDGKGDTETAPEVQAESLYELLPEELRDSEYLEGMQTVRELAANYIALAESVGSLPCSPDEYEVPDYGLDEDELLLQSFKETAFQIGLTAEQVRYLTDWHAGYIMAVQDMHERMLTEELEELQHEWGHRYKENLQTAARGFKAIADERFREMVEVSGLGNHPIMIRTFYRLGRAISEDALLESGVGKRQKKSPGEILYPNQGK